MKSIIPGLLAAVSLCAAANDSRLAAAAERGDMEAVRSLLQQKAEVNGAQGDGTTALHWAVSNDDLAMTQMLLASGADVNAATRLGSITPLFMACSNGNAAIIEALLKAGANANTPKAEGTTPLMMAAASGNANAVQVLLDHGAAVNAKESAHGQTALMFAADLNRDAAIKTLLEHGADPAIATEVVRVGRGLAAETPRKAPATTRAGNVGNPEGGAANAAPPVALEDRIQGAKVMGGMTALLFAARDGHMEAIRTLLAGGADVNQVSPGDNTSPMLMAIINGHNDAAKLLLDHGADPNLASTSELAPLYAAVDAQWAPLGWFPNPITAEERISHVDLMKALLDHGANPNARLAEKLWFRPLTHELAWASAGGATPYWRAAQANDVAAMRLLIGHGADPKIPSSDGDTPLMVAAGVGWRGNFTVTAPDTWVEAVKFALEQDANVNAMDAKGYTALHGAAYRGSNEVVQLLADKGARADIIAKSGDSPADMAFGPERYGTTHPETVALLVKLGSPFQNSCRSDQCLPPPKLDKAKPSAALAPAKLPSDGSGQR